MRCGFWPCSETAKGIGVLWLCIATLLASATACAANDTNESPVLIDQSTWPTTVTTRQGQHGQADVIVLQAPPPPADTPAAPPSLEIGEPARVYLPQGVKVVHAAPKTYRTPELAQEVRKHYTINIGVYGLWLALGILLVL